MHTGYEVEFDFVEDDQVEFQIVEFDNVEVNKVEFHIVEGNNEFHIEFDNVALLLLLCLSRQLSNDNLH